MSLNEELILAIASDLNVDPSFAEKDWYATQVMAVVNAISNEKIRLFFVVVRHCLNVLVYSNVFLKIWITEV